MIGTNSKLVESMALLCQDPKFKDFMEEVGEMKDQCVRDLCNDAVLGNQNSLLATIGEIRAHLSILDAHKGFLDNARQIALDSQQV